MHVHINYACLHKVLDAEACIPAILDFAVIICPTGMQSILDSMLEK